MILPTTHRAFTWQGSADPADLLLTETQIPKPEADDVLIRNVVIGLNPVDWKVLGGQLVNWQPGHVPGVDGAGVVVAVGDNVCTSWVGQRIAYHQSLGRHGSFAEYTPVRASAVLRVPAMVSWEHAASLPCPGLTAWLALEKLPQSCRTLLVSGAGGSVANHLIQIAVRRGLKVTSLSHRRHAQRLADLGVAECMEGPLDQAWSGPMVFDAVIDTVNAEHAARLEPALRANGHLVCVQDRLHASPIPPFTRTISLHEVALAALHTFGDDRAWQALVDAGEGMLTSMGRAQWTPESYSVASFERLPDHLTGLQQRTFSGKGVIRVAND
ncbi:MULTISPECIES: alcohol dehydrogenase catalytic domain-containing protein [Pseudomonas]|jgi:NADPH:quinone reductase-like Zn-dependent oxidoreductase|uniref:alcohol dehydrogenase catalytic domain-containing protein n=2 Tax=Pseudomonas TaxID=286 RepID=UPI0001FB90FE|nr:MULTISPECIES: alcohol dehydrogenase catalytic domain-containing protein [Pseudomonas]EGB97191.1 alcohol dehydrogenase [Pseudomonas sp. TJI-51]MBA6123419.1 alcohol dehydrogenase catalytic domain-containing protein [Pseudomonas juntendi]MBI6915523.1 alcohol dehydrogenase catalytic domain-containing protein [Pseudomonas juntendi]MCF3158747.1 alcohol dehydrogenase catalytic domain-containing protein [Pseudomonas juntendi]MCQ1992042.1 alcohol dehydrogenase catalytic domain-containing protein [Ps